MPIKSKSYMFGDYRSVVTSATFPHSTLSKRHNILAFHRVREAIAAKIIDFHWIQSEYNLNDMLSNHWEYNKIFPMIQKLLMTCGNRILSKVQKSFWSCTHVNSCWKYILHINLHILLMILFKISLKIKKSRKSNKNSNRYTQTKFEHWK